MSHRCSDSCHRCPDLNGDIMPGCMGTAVLSDGTDMSYCTCGTKSAKDKFEELRTRIIKLEGKLLEMNQPKTKSKREI